MPLGTVSADMRTSRRGMSSWPRSLIRPAIAPPTPRRPSTGATISRSTATVVYDSQDKEYQVLGDHIYGAAGSFTVNIAITERGVTSYTGGQATIKSGWSVIGGQVTYDPNDAMFVSLGQAEVALNTGGVRISHPSISTSAQAPRLARPLLVYNSDNVDVRPGSEAEIKSMRSDTVPESIDVQLTWDGVTQDWVTLGTDGQQPGDAFLVSAQVKDAVAESGLYPWSLHVVMKFGGNKPDYNAEVTGLARVVVNDSPARDPVKPFESIDFVGAGWGIAGIDRLVVNDPDTGNVL